jgi:hypothetical protein
VDLRFLTPMAVVAKALLQQLLQSIQGPGSAHTNM